MNKSPKITFPGEYITVKQAFTKMNIPYVLEDAKDVGIIVTNRCEEANVTIKKVPDKEWGQVNAYPENLIMSILSNLTIK